MLENAIYSTSGTWGLLFSHERHAVLGGPTQFVRAITEMLPNPVGQVEKFLATWKQHHVRFGSNLDWFPCLLEHVYGADAAQRFLETGQPSSTENAAETPRDSAASKLDA